MDTFINALYTKNHSLIKTNADDTLKSHLLVFAAEESRKSNSVLKLWMNKFIFLVKEKKKNVYITI